MLKPAPSDTASTLKRATPCARVVVRAAARTPLLLLDAAEAEGVPVTQPAVTEGAVAVPVTVAVAGAGVPTANEASDVQREEDPAG